MFVQSNYIKMFKFNFNKEENMKKISLLIILCSIFDLANAQWNKCLEGQGTEAIFTTEASHFIGCTGWVVGGHTNLVTTFPFNIIFKTTDCGDHWDTLIFSGNDGLRDVYFVDENIGYVVGGNNGGGTISVYKTLDGGNAWNPLGQSYFANIGLNNVQFLNADTGYVCGTNGAVYRTEDGGDTWIDVSLSNAIYLDAMHFLNADVGMVSSATFGGHFVYKTEDAGLTWQEINLNLGNNFGLSSIQFFNENDVVGLNTEGPSTYFNYVKSTDGGATWNILFGQGQNENSGAFNTDGDNLHFLNENEGYAYFWHHDGNWINSWTFGDTIVSVFTIGEDSAFATSRNGRIYRSFGDPCVTFEVEAGFGNDTLCGYEGMIIGGNPTADNGVEPYIYQWSDGFSGANTYVPLLDHLYYVTVEDFNGCVGVDSVYVQEGSVEVDAGPDVSIDTLCAGGCLQLEAFTTGGPSPYTWIWNPSTFMNNPELSNPIFCTPLDTVFETSLTVVATDLNGCMGIDTINLFISPNNFSATITSNQICAGDSIFQMEINGGTAPYSFEVMPEISEDFLGPYTILVTDSIGCVDYDSAYFNEIIIDTSCVWPGDANYDGTANMFDLLSIGTGYNTSGTIRDNASSNWESQPATNWSQQFADGVNYKHADCDGNGLINDLDTTAIYLNYGLTHTKNNNVLDATEVDPDLFFEITPELDTVEASASVDIPIHIGTQATPASNIYGVVFSIYFDPSLVSMEDLAVTFDGSWLGTDGTDMITMQKLFYDEGQLDVGLVRTNQQNNSGYGKIGTLSIVMQDDISGKTSDLFETLSLSFGNIKLININEEEIPLNTSNAEIVVWQEGAVSTAIISLDEKIAVFPNPANNDLQIVAKNEMTQIIVENLKGQQIYSQKLSNKYTHLLSVENFIEGLYFIKITSKNGVVIKKFMVE